MSMPQELINTILFKWGGLSMKKELKEELMDGYMEFWMNWNYQTKGWEWWDPYEEWDDPENDPPYHEYDNDIDTRIPTRGCVICETCDPKQIILTCFKCDKKYMGFEGNCCCGECCSYCKD